MNEPQRSARMSPLEKSKRHPRSAALAIAAYCYHECNNEDATNSHTTKVAVRDCKMDKCPLWPFRGWQNITGGCVGERT